MAYFEKLQNLSVPASEGIALLDLAPDVAPAPEDEIDKLQGRRRTQIRAAEE